MATRAPVADVDDDPDEIFNASSYALPVPAVDGHKAGKISIRFVGVVDLDRTSEEQLDFVNALSLGAPVRVIVTGSVSGKGFTHRRNADDEDDVGYYASLRVDDVELGEPA